ncbi:SCP2 sterol-binding domain-containing protein [Natronomonas salina]|uniref:SCP2 sterol-binding domain-containing protein n=1 Tax=Natronomonas salina TaxID=1710540 RepID=UPI0015B5E938|nr:SCP2 sterol-binding domain-containing protein [Natronomonas salina]QLD90752.1 SCP2 sterol-binding domain-containing protein [Natronomonas salina]
MAIPFPSEAWITEWRHRLNDNEEYAEAGQGWGVGFDGDFVFHVRADDRLPEDAYFYIGLEDGRCTEATRIEHPDAVDAGFIYRGDYSDWVALNQGEIGPIDGMMSGVFDIEGDMQKVLQYSDAAVAMSETGQVIDTDYKY